MVSAPKLVTESSGASAADRQELSAAKTRTRAGNSKAKGVQQLSAEGVCLCVCVCVFVCVCVCMCVYVCVSACIFFQFVPKSPDPELLKPCPSKTLTQRITTRGSTKLSAGGVYIYS